MSRLCSYLPHLPTVTGALAGSEMAEGLGLGFGHVSVPAGYLIETWNSGCRGYPPGESSRKEGGA